MERAPLLVPALALLAGIVFERLPTISLCAAAIFFVTCNLATPVRTRRWATAAACAFAAGVLLGAWRGHPPTVDAERPPRAYHGLVTSDVRRADWGVSFTLTLDDGTALETSLASAAMARRGHPAAERIGPGTLLAIRGSVVPFDEPRNPGEPSERALATERGIAGKLERTRLLNVAAAPWSEPRALLPRLRAWAAAALREHLDEPYASVVAGALFGERDRLPHDLKREFQETGTVHVLVTAGLHLGVVAALVTWLLTSFRVARVPAALAAIAVVWAYALASGAHLPSQRAATMISLALLARAAGARVISWNALAAAAIVVAALWPASVGSASFGLSFSCVAAILLFAEPIAQALERARVPSLLREPIALTVATQIGVWPLTAATFLIVAPFAPLANLAVVPVVSVCMTLGLAQLMTTSIAPVAAACANLNAWCVAWMLFAVHAVASLPGASFVATPPPPWTLAAYDGAMLGAGMLLARRAALAAVLLVGGACALVAWPPRLPHRDLTITVLDVGQGDAIVVHTPAGHTLMIDTGGRLERGVTADGQSPAEAIGERIVLPYLIRSGVRFVDGIVVTHPHGDHVGGAAPILRTLGVGWIADSGQIYGGHAYQDMLGEAARRGVPVERARCGDVRQTDDGVTLRFLSPCPPFFTDGKNDVNENSVVVMLEYRNLRALFMGDAGAQAEERLIAAGSDLHADLLKVGHHGSAYSSTPAFIEAVSPQNALISVGRHNLFGHPAPRTLETLQRHGVKVWRTDLCGAVTVEVQAASALPTLACTARFEEGGG